MQNHFHGSQTSKSAIGSIPLSGHRE